MLAWILSSFCLLSIFAPALRAQQLPDAAALVAQSGQAAKKLHSEQSTVSVSMGMTMPGGGAPGVSETMKVAAVHPGKTRMDMTAMGTTFLVVSDGSTTWMYDSRSNEFVKKSEALGPAILSSMGMRNMPDFAKVHGTYKILREDTIEIEGQKHDCWVVEGHIDASTLPQMKGAEIKNEVVTMWLDKKLDLDLRNNVSMEMVMPGSSQTMQMSMSTNTTSLEVDQPIPDSTFTFTPPADAKQVDQLFGATAAAGVDLTGQPAPSFSVTDLTGKAYSLASLKGTPVLLDFWATWCGPCRESLPGVHDIYEKYKGQGLVVLGVDAGEDRATVEQFLKTNPFEYPVILGGESHVLDDYHVMGYPTFVLINADGKVAAEETGYGGQESLAGMLAKAGLGAPSAAASTPH